MNTLKKLPYPIAGTALGFAALGNLLASYHPLLKTGSGTIAAILILALIVKIIRLPESFPEAMENPMIASTMATFPMTLMILSTYPAKGPMALTIWIIGLILHSALIVWFTGRFILKGFDFKKVFPSWFILFVGIVAASVAAPYHGQKTVGTLAFWFGLAAYLILLALVSYRMIKKGKLPDPARPTLVIYAAPASLLLAGYMNSVESKSLPLVYFLLALSIFFYLFSLVSLPNLLTLPFFPSYSSFTFPFVISAIAIRSTQGFFTKSGSTLDWLTPFTQIQPWIAAILCIYVLIRFGIALSVQPKPLAASQVNPQS